MRIWLLHYFPFFFFRGNGDAIKHAYQLIVALLKNSDTELIDLVSIVNDEKIQVRSMTSASKTDNEDETNKSQRNHSLQILPNPGSHFYYLSFFRAIYLNHLSFHSESTTNIESADCVMAPSKSTDHSTRLIINSNKKSVSSVSQNPNRQTSRSSSSTTMTTKTSLPLTTTGAMWVNSSRSNRGTSSSGTANSNTGLSVGVWNSTSTSKISFQSNSSYSNKSNGQNNRYVSMSHKKPEPLLSLNVHSSTKPSKSTVRIANETQLNDTMNASTHQTAQSTMNLHSPVASSDKLKSSLTAEEYNPFASNILTSSLADVLTKPKETILLIDDNDGNTTKKMNFADAARRNVFNHTNSSDPVGIELEDSVPSHSNPKIVSGYWGSNSVQPQQTSSYGNVSPTSQLSRAPGANRQSVPVSPSIDRGMLDHSNPIISMDQSSSSPLFRPVTNPTLSSSHFGPIGSHRTSCLPPSVDPNYSDNSVPIRTNFNQTPPISNPIPFQAVPSQPSIMLNNHGFMTMPSNRSNLNPGAPEFQHAHRLPTGFIPSTGGVSPLNNAPMSANIMGMARMMEQQQHPNYLQSVASPVYPVYRAPTPTPSEIETMQHVQNQVLHFFHLHANQQQMMPPPPQLPTTLQIANMLAAKGQLPQDLNQAAALVAAYYYTNFMSRVPISTTMTNNIPTSSTVNTNGFKMVNPNQTDDISVHSSKQ